MRRLKIGKLKIPFLLVFWFFKRMAARFRYIAYRISRKRKKVYETHIQDLLKFRDDSPFYQIATPPFTIRVSAACVVLGKYVSSTLYHMARSHPTEIYAFVLGRRLGDLFVGETVFEVNNILQSSTSALADLTHVFEIKREVASRFPDLEIVCTVHSHPSGVLWPSKADKLCFLGDDHPNIIVSSRRLLWGSPIKRLAAFYHNSGKVRKIKLHEIDKKEVELKDIDIKELTPSKEELLDIGEMATEIDFNIYKVWLVSHPNLTLKKLGKKLSELFGDKIGFAFLYKEKNKDWTFDPTMKVIDYFLQDSDHLVFPEFFEEVNK